MRRVVAALLVVATDSLQLDPEGRATLMLRSVENVVFGWLRDHRD